MIFKPLGADSFSAPFGSSSKQIAPLLGAGVLSGLGAGAVSALGGIASSLFGSSSQQKANETNERIAKENREWQTKENQVNRDWSEKMWQAENQYNTPSAMMQRYKEAGLNPFLVGGQSAGSVGQAGAPNSPSMVGAPNQPDIRGYDYAPLAQGFAAAGNSLLQGIGVNANVANQNANTLLTLSKATDEWMKSGSKPEQIMPYINSVLKSMNLSNKEIVDYQTSVNNKYLNYSLDTTAKEFEVEFTRAFGKQKAKAEMEKAREVVNELKSLVNLNNAKERESRANKLYIDAKRITENETREFVKRQMEALADYYDSQNLMLRNSYSGSDNWFIKALNTLSNVLNLGASFGIHK